MWICWFCQVPFRLGLVGEFWSCLKNVVWGLFKFLPFTNNRSTTFLFSTIFFPSALTLLLILSEIFLYVDVAFICLNLVYIWYFICKNEELFWIFESMKIISILNFNLWCALLLKVIFSLRKLKFYEGRGLGPG